MTNGTEIKRVFILTANPKDTDRLRLDEEMREIHVGLERAKRRDRFEIITRWAVRPDDLRRAMLDVEPQILHFSGHGAGDEGLALENETGQAKLVSSEALSNLFALFAGVECVLLNACYSEVQAEAIHRHVDYVIGMSKAIGDRAAVKFAVGFYDGLGAGRSYSDAYKFGCSAIDFEDVRQQLIPVLKTRKKDESASPLPLLALEQPDGQVPLGSPFYVERPPIESDCYGAIAQRRHERGFVCSSSASAA